MFFNLTEMTKSRVVLFFLQTMKLLFLIKLIDSALGSPRWSCQVVAGLVAKVVARQVEGWIGVAR